LSGGDGLPRFRRPGRTGRPGPAHLRRPPDPAGGHRATGQPPERGPTPGVAPTEPRSSARIAAYGRYARNAMIQGAAAELFKMWAVIVRARCAPLGARIVLCLHDELLVHSPREQAEAVSRLVDECLREAAQRWAPGCGVR